MDPNYDFLVSISCIVYNHAAYLHSCFEGFLKQKTDFRFEILVHDDASTDGSVEIIQDYAERYPNIFKPIFEKENQYSTGRPYGSAVWNFPRAQGKYIALCEGDDYWTDPLKLQKQVDYMEAHPDCTMCFHNSIIHWETGIYPDQLFAPLENRDYSGSELCEECISPTASFVFRTSLANDYSKLRLSHPRIIVGDVPLALYCSTRGSVHCLGETMSVYRKHSSGFMANYANKNYSMGMYWDEMGRIFGKDFYRFTKKKAVLNYLRAISYSVKNRDYRTAFFSFIKGVLLHPLTALPIIVRIPYEKHHMIKESN